ncbi:MAG: LAGLIDADG family homing endonuclease [bacterium]|nr:LAGLIDADG family homing endonuclease [bacterium]
MTIPKPSVDLAEFFGIMIGDGGINNPWQANITLNSEADARFVVYVTNLCSKLFGVLPAVRKRNDSKAVVISLASTTIVNFLVDNGLPRGNKLKLGLQIPHWILAKKEYRIACVRGLMDTDGCLYIHRHKVLGTQYSNIALCFCSASPMLVVQVSSIFEEFGIVPHVNMTGRNIYLYKEQAVEKYLKVFGTSNDRINSVYKKWRVARAV